jgi:hypothetical protein
MLESGVPPPRPTRRPATVAWLLAAVAAALDGVPRLTAAGA